LWLKCGFPGEGERRSGIKMNGISGMIFERDSGMKVNTDPG